MCVLNIAPLQSLCSLITFLKGKVHVIGLALLKSLVPWCVAYPMVCDHGHCPAEDISSKDLLAHEQSCSVSSHQPQPWGARNLLFLWICPLWRFQRWNLSLGILFQSKGLLPPSLLEIDALLSAAGMQLGHFQVLGLVKDVWMWGCPVAVLCEWRTQEGPAK